MRALRRLVNAGIVLFLVAALLLGAQLSGGAWAPESGDASKESGEGEICRIRMTYPIWEGISVITDLEEIQEEVNEISRKEIGVEVELIPVDVNDAKEDYLLWLGRGDTLDLMLIRDQDIHSYIDKGFLTSLSGHLERNAQSVWLLDKLMEGKLTGRTKQQGRIYGVANLTEQTGYGYGVWVSRALLEQLDYSYDPNHIYTLEELDEIFSGIKYLYPDSYPLGQITAGTQSTTAFYYMDVGDALGGDLSTGVVFDENDAVMNLFTTMEYYTLLSYLQQWYEAEYIYPDSVIYDAPITDLLRNQTVWTVPASSYPGTMELLMGQETDYVCLKTTEPRERSGYDGDFWTVPVTSRYPAEAVKFLDLIYSDQRVSYLLNYGISGEHYEISDQTNRLLTPVRDEKSRIQGFYNPFAGIGDTRNMYSFGNANIQAQRKAYNSGAKPAGARYAGFSYSSADVSRQTDAVKKVVETYVPILESGSADLRKNYPEFLKELREAGIDEILRDKQEQLDSWLRQP